ncbi:hypothetical protein JQC92_09130 [Shewanella sp. 202IG2-18]|uniref:hypothetical protein n=1 Tax=Parashewanella hymeniacidonis TaxID=2807618 RepID=UPI001960075A|nr:hypothetical protein [Parashewanella hymeniacidonis]MBM7072188.1 hypothetical protein [Parashewanella hymeniacidonis]
MKSIFGLILIGTSAIAVEQDFSGVIDVRAIYNDSIQSYVDGGFGKLRFNSGTHVSISQLGLSHHVDWTDNISSKIVANGYLDNTNEGLGITEAFIQYKGLPSENGYRITAKAGILYPTITIENHATAWTSPYTLSFSTINSWLAEEVRHLGSSLSLSRLGKFHQSKHDVKLTAEAFVNNDPTGAMLSWHGWTTGSRQTLWHETIRIPELLAMRSDGLLSGQAKESDPFLDLDTRVGANFTGEWNWRGNGKLTVGYYDNNADTSVVKNGQYSWRTRFHHLGVKWRLPLKIDLLAQFLKGDTLMKALTGKDAVNNDYHSFNILLSKAWYAHRISMRFEDFSVTDNDQIWGDNNNEDGNAFTASYRYQLQKGLFIHSEFNWVTSERFARTYVNQPEKLIEKQWQVAMRYYF